MNTQLVCNGRYFVGSARDSRLTALRIRICGTEDMVYKPEQLQGRGKSLIAGRRKNRQEREGQL